VFLVYIDSIPEEKKDKFQFNNIEVRTCWNTDENGTIVENCVLGFYHNVSNYINYSLKYNISGEIKNLGANPDTYIMINLFLYNSTGGSILSDTPLKFYYGVVYQIPLGSSKNFSIEIFNKDDPDKESWEQQVCKDFDEVESYKIRAHDTGLNK